MSESSNTKDSPFYKRTANKSSSRIRVNSSSGKRRFKARPVTSQFRRFKGNQR